MSTDDTNAARRGSGSNDLLGQATERADLTPATMKRLGCYNWKGQPDRLVYLGRNWSGNGWWHQFRKIGDPRRVWCEVTDADLHMLEETADVERCQCGYPMPCALNVPIGFCKA